MTLYGNIVDVLEPKAYVIKTFRDLLYFLVLCHQMLLHYR